VLAGASNRDSPGSLCVICLLRWPFRDATRRGSLNPRHPVVPHTLEVVHRKRYGTEKRVPRTKSGAIAREHDEAAESASTPDARTSRPAVTPARWLGAVARGVCTPGKVGSSSDLFSRSRAEYAARDSGLYD
jgi:hypothetical protein